MTSARTRTTPERSHRMPGRPGAEASGSRREQLLDAALQTFAERGISNASLREIAQAAEVTPALANYYFGGKDALLQAVIEERLWPVLMQLRQALVEAGPDPLALAEHFVTAVNHAVVQHPWLPQLWLREILSEGGQLREFMLARVAPELPLTLAAGFAVGQRTGVINPGLDPRLTVVSLIGLSLFPAAAASLWRRIFKAEDIDAQALTSHTLSLLRHGLSAHPAEQSP